MYFQGGYGRDKTLNLGPLGDICQSVCSCSIQHHQGCVFYSLTHDPTVSHSARIILVVLQGRTILQTTAGYGKHCLPLSFTCRSELIGLAVMRRLGGSQLRGSSASPMLYGSIGVAVRFCLALPMISRSPSLLLAVNDELSYSQIQRRCHH
jgi:hypothetical protein